MVFCGPGLIPLPQVTPMLCPFTLSLGLRQPQAWPIRASTPLAPGLNPGGGCPHGQPKSSKPGTLVRLLLKSPPLSMGKEQGLADQTGSACNSPGALSEGAPWEGSPPWGRQPQGVEKEAVS